MLIFDSSEFGYLYLMKNGPRLRSTKLAFSNSSTGISRSKRSIGLRFSLFEMVGSQKSCRNFKRSALENLSLYIARCSGVFPLLSCALRLPPASYNTFTSYKGPEFPAICRGVHPALLRTLVAAPAFNSISAMAIRCFFTASDNGVSPSLFLRFTLSMKSIPHISMRFCRP